MKKKPYETAELTVDIFDVEEIITTSPFTTSGYEGSPVEG